MWQHFLYQISHVSHFKLDCFIRSVWSYEPAAPSLLNYVEQFGSICILANRKARSYLPTEAMTLARLERNAETTFSVHKSRDIRCCVHKQRSEPACYEILMDSIQGVSTLESLRGFALPRILPSVLHAMLLQASGGLHRFELVE